MWGGLLLFQFGRTPGFTPSCSLGQLFRQPAGPTRDRDGGTASTWPETSIRLLPSRFDHSRQAEQDGMRNNVEDRESEWGLVSP